MTEIERLTIALPTELAAAVEAAVSHGDYASAGEVVREALHDWSVKRAVRVRELAALKADIDKGLADVAAGRVTDFDTSRIIARGRQLSSGRSTSG
jgi:antitoxin ParD1/3/4